MPATYEPIATTTLGSAVSSITFSSISSSYTDLKLIFVGRSDTGSGYANIRFNGDTASNYSSTYIQGVGSNPVNTSRYTSTTSLLVAANNSLSSTIPKMYEMDIFSYGGSVNKTILSKGLGDTNNTAGLVEYFVGLWRNSSAINSVTIFATVNNFAIGTIATLYGILKA